MRPARYALILLLAAVCLGLPFAISGYLGRGAQWFDMPSEATVDPSSHAAFQDGYRSERAGDLAAALAKYRIAENSKVAAIEQAGIRAAERVNSKLNNLGPGYDALRKRSGVERYSFQ
jgi:hypothetical protein